MTVSLTPAQADAKISQITDARDQAVQKMRQIEDTQQTMLAKNWLGDAAVRYARDAQQQHEDFNQIISTLNQVVETGSTHIRSIANQDNT